MVLPLRRIRAEVRDLAVAITCGRYELSRRGFKSLAGQGRDSVQLPLHTLGDRGPRPESRCTGSASADTEAGRCQRSRGRMSEQVPLSAVALELPCERGAPAIVPLASCASGVGLRTARVRPQRKGATLV
jgi:hypothetical protein